MPVAVVTEPSVRFDLQTCPGGYVVVRRMTYGQHLYRQSIGAQMLIRSENRDTVGEVKNMQREVALWEFANLVEKHNLQDVDGRELNFQNAADVSQLTGKIGDEISSYISDLNNFEKEVNAGNSLGSSEPQSNSTGQSPT